LSLAVFVERLTARGPKLFHPLSVVPILALASSCAGQTGGGAGPGTPSGQPPGWDDGIRIPAATDINGDPNIVEVDLEARVTNFSFVPGGPTPAWTYNGLLPGPLIRAAVGNRVIVHFRNSLPEETTIHWHGLRIPAAMDGMPDLSQPPIAPGGTFDYDFVVPDASTFWYHPHADAAAQVGYGMYGPFIVDDPAEPQGLGDEVVMVLSDIAVNDDGSLQSPAAAGDLGTLFGREGNILLVNGKVRPTLKARPGLPQRWRIINAAKTRYYQLEMAGHSFVRIGGDGGLMTAPVTVAEPVLAPAERADLIVVPQGDPGSDVVVRWIPFDRGYGSLYETAQDLFVVHLEGTPLPTPPMSDVHRDIAPLPLDGATPVAIALTLDSATPLELGINGVAYQNATPYMANVGETQIWTVTNPTIEFAHPFHMHGFFFQVLTNDDPPAPVAPLEWKDTVNVPVSGTVKLAVKFDDRPGMWMFHCHILDHAEAGMMGMLMVMEPPSP
jgi:FtsP/CotA-like multicopper oxidase with cupredoxin domain